MLIFNKVQFTGKISDPVKPEQKSNELFVRFTLIQRDFISSRKGLQPREVTTQLICELKGKKARTFAENVGKDTHLFVEGKLECDPDFFLRLRVSVWHFL